MAGRIYQFGTSRFLQAHVALFAHEAREAGQNVLPITVVQVTNSADRAGRLAAFNNVNGYPVIIRGIDRGKHIEKSIQVKSIENGISARRNWEVLMSAFTSDCRFIVSNVGDSGYEVASADWVAGALAASDGPQSFPAMLTALLFNRWQLQPAAVTIFPCELVPGNGQVLKTITIELAIHHELGADFVHWLDQRVIWVSSLVDRIVSEPIEPVGAIAEPYALWAIEANHPIEMPFIHDAVILSANIQIYERLKLYILNQSHTAIAHRWLTEKLDPHLSVRQFLEKTEHLQWLRKLYDNEILPVFAFAGLGLEASQYVETTIDRFRNPYLDHRIADIADGHQAKVNYRTLGFLKWAEQIGAKHQNAVLGSILTADLPLSA